MLSYSDVVRNSIRVVTLFLSLTLVSCVTTSNSSLTKKADPEVAVEKFVQLGLVYIGKGDFHMASKKINRALEINPESAQANAALGLLYSQQGENEKAEEHYAMAIEYDPSYTRGRNYYGAYLFSAERYQEALVQFEFAVMDTQYEGRAQIYSNIALCHLRLGSKNEAISAYDQTLRLDRNNGRALSGITELLVQIEDFEQAQRYYNRLIRLIRDQDMKHSAQSLWLGIRIARYYGSSAQADALSEMLSSMYPNSEENAQSLARQYLRGRH